MTWTLGGGGGEEGAVDLWLIHQVHDHRPRHGIHLLRHSVELDERMRLIAVPRRLIAAAHFRHKQAQRIPAAIDEVQHFVDMAGDLYALHRHLPHVMVGVQPVCSNAQDDVWDLPALVPILHYFNKDSRITGTGGEVFLAGLVPARLQPLPTDFSQDDDAVVLKLLYLPQPGGAAAGLDLVQLGDELLHCCNK